MEPQSRTAPWASERALTRLAEVEAALATDPSDALAAATRAAREHARRIDEDCLLLYAGTNVPREAQDHEALLAAQPSMGYPGDKYQAGLEPIDVIEVTASQAIARVMQARFAEVRLTSATLANLAVYTALTQPGDTIAVLPDWAGGHLSHHAIGVPGVRGLNVVPLPYDDEELDVDLDALPAFLARHQPKLVVVGASLMLFPHRLSEIAGIVDVPLLYDASHVAGFIAERRFQAPLQEGADLMTFSTYKSFGGPPGGAIVTNDEKLAERVSTAAYPGLLANYDASRLLPLARTALERETLQGAYADQCIANAQALARELDAAGLDVLGKARGFTVSHHVAIDARAHGGGPRAARTLASGGILLSEIGIPRDPAGGVRIGTQAITRQGFTEEDMPAIADAFAKILNQEPADVPAIRRRHQGLQFTL